MIESTLLKNEITDSARIYLMTIKNSSFLDVQQVYMQILAESYSNSYKNKQNSRNNLLKIKKNEDYKKIF